MANKPRRVLQRLRSLHSDHRAIASGIAHVALFVLLASCARAAKDIAVAYYYGTSPQVDAYLLLFNLITGVVGIWFSAISIVLVPLISRIKQASKNELPQFKSELLGLTLLTGLVTWILAWQGLPVLLRSSWVGLPAGTINLAMDFMPAMIILAPLGLIISLYSSIMLAESRHTNTLLESIPPLAILAILVTFPSGLAAPLVWGTILGFALHCTSLAACMNRGGGLNLPHFNYKSPHWPSFWSGFRIMLAGQTFIGSAGIIDQLFAANLEPGSIATLNYASRILALALGIGSLAVSRATLPVFSKIQAEGRNRLYPIAMQWARLIFIVSMAAAFFGWIAAQWGIKLLFERGAFTASDTQAVSQVLRYGLMQLPFFLSGSVFVSVLSSQGRYGVIATIATSSLIVKVIAMTVLTPSMGLTGIALSTSLMYAASLCMLTLSVTRGKK